MALKFTPEMVTIAEEMQIDQVRQFGAIAMMALESVARYPRLMVGASIHAEHAKERLQAYEKASVALANVFEDLDRELGDARGAQFERDKVRAADEARAALDAAVDAGKLTHPDRLLRDSVARGDGKVSMSCPVCETGKRLNAGVCAVCNAYAIDLRDPNPPSAVRYNPAPKPIGGEVPADPALVPITKTDTPEPSEHR